jgi:hypothetical protein
MAAAFRTHVLGEVRGVALGIIGNAVRFEELALR